MVTITNIAGRKSSRSDVNHTGQGTGSPSCLELPLLPRRYLTSTAGKPPLYHMYIYIYVYTVYIYIQYIYNIYTFHMISPASSWLPLPTRRLVNLISCCSFLLTKYLFLLGKCLANFHDSVQLLNPTLRLNPSKHSTPGILGRG